MTDSSHLVCHGARDCHVGYSFEQTVRTAHGSRKVLRNLWQLKETDAALRLAAGLRPRVFGVLFGPQWVQAVVLVLATAVDVGTSISLAMAAVLLQGTVLVRTGLTLRALRQRLGFGTRRLLQAQGQSTDMALAAGLLTAASAWVCRQAGAQALVTPGCYAVVVGAAALGAAIAIGHPLGQEVRRALAGRGRRIGSA